MRLSSKISVRSAAPAPVRLLVVPAAALFGVVLIAATAATQDPQLDTRADERRRERFTNDGSIAPETLTTATVRPPTEAPSGFDNQTNGMDPQGPSYETLNEDTVEPLRSFNDNRFIFEETESIDDGLGPTYNAQCAVSAIRTLSPAVQARSRSTGPGTC